MECQITRQDLQELRSAGLRAFMEKHGLRWEKKAGLTNNERRDALWVRLAGEGQETATVDAAWWAAASVWEATPLSHTAMYDMVTQGHA